MVVAAHPVGELLVSTGSAVVLRWAGQLARDADRCRRRFVEHLLDAQHMLPPVAEVVVVPEPIAHFRDDLVEASIVLEQAFIAHFDVEPGQKRGWVAVVARVERVQMAVHPAHRHLQHVVQAIEREIAGDVDAPPDGRFGA